MKIIAHRGNTKGPSLSDENDPAYIDEALKFGYDAEIDVWFLNNKFYLGHDIYKLKCRTTIEYLDNEKLWVHAKNQQALHELVRANQIHELKCNFFFHAIDECALTSKNYIWTSNISCNQNNVVLVYLENHPLQNCNYHGVCTDNVSNVMQLNLNLGRK